MLGIEFKLIFECKNLLNTYIGIVKKGKKIESMSLKQIVPHLNKLLDQEIVFVDDCSGEEAEKAAEKLQP